MLEKDTMSELRQMKVDVNNKKASLKSKNYQKDKVTYFKKTKTSDDNLRIRVEFFETLYEMVIEPYGL